jgi:predicted Rossmann-fold nucleotide-binding protein
MERGEDNFKIVSGGQTGADRAALDWAIENGIPHGGWCPKGRKAEDGRIDARYSLKETPTSKYIQRTEWNVRDSDATVIFSTVPVLTGGPKRTFEFAKKHRKPCLILRSEGSDTEPAVLLNQFIVNHKVGVLNVAGARASNEPEIAAFVRTALSRWWREY